MEGLGDIIVGARIEPLHLVAPAVTRGQNEHRHLFLIAAPFLEHADAVQHGQAKVEDDCIIGLRLAQIVAFLAILGAVNHVACVGESGNKLTVQVGVVFDNEDAHGGLF